MQIAAEIEEIRPKLKREIQFTWSGVCVCSCCMYDCISGGYLTRVVTDELHGRGDHDRRNYVS